MMAAVKMCTLQRSSSIGHTCGHPIEQQQGTRDQAGPVNMSSEKGKLNVLVTFSSWKCAFSSFKLLEITVHLQILVHMPSECS